MDLIFKLNEQLKETEKELGKALQSKQGELTTIPQIVTPMVSTVVPSTIATSLAPNIPLATTLPTIIITSTSEVVVTSKKQIEDLIKSMEEMKIQSIEIKKLKEIVTSLERNYELSQINYTEEERRNRRMTERIKTLEQDLTLEKPLRDIRDIIWTNIIDYINDIWSAIQIIFEQTELVKLTLEVQDPKNY